MTFYQKFLKQCARKGVSASKAAKDIGLSNAAATGWKNGKQPQEITVLKLAEYFGCSIENLTADKIKNPPKDGGVSDQDLMFALFDGDEAMTEDDLAAVRRYAAFLREDKRK